jgi:zinc and cadmium transporter
MSDPHYLLAIYCILVFAASLLGGWVLLIIHPTHTRLQVATSFVAGLMLGIALLHFLPDAIEQTHAPDLAMGWVLSGFLSIFFLQRFFHFHHHDSPSGDPENCCHEADIEEDPHHSHPEHAHTLANKSARQLSWVGTAIGLSLHSIFDGLALAASVAVGATGHQALAGLGVALVVILHKPFDAMAISTLMTVGGSSRNARHLLNALFALVSPIGALLFYFGASRLVEVNGVLLGDALAFCAGTFLCISASDLLPELQFHSHDRMKLSVSLILGLVVTILLKHFEGA